MQQSGGERSERRLWRIKRGERVAAVEKIKHRRCADFFRAPQQGVAAGWTAATPYDVPSAHRHRISQAAPPPFSPRRAGACPRRAPSSTEHTNQTANVTTCHPERAKRVEGSSHTISQKTPGFTPPQNDNTLVNLINTPAYPSPTDPPDE